MKPAVCVLFIIIYTIITILLCNNPILSKDFKASSDSRTMEVEMKVRIQLDKDGQATITEGENTFIGKLLASKGKLKIRNPLFKKDVEIKTK